MAKAIFGSSHSIHWNSVSKILVELKESRPWACGLVLLEDAQHGLLSEAGSSELTALTQRVTALYKQGCLDDKSWIVLAQDLRQADCNIRTTDATRPEVSWSEYRAFAVLISLVMAAHDHLSGDSASWRQAMAQAYLDSSGWTGDVAMARFPRPARPAAPLYEDRVREIAAYDKAMEQATVAHELRSEAARANQVRLLSGPLAIHRAIVAANEAAEVARVAALPLHRRWYHHVRQAFANSAG